jgi:hypothetical protein
VLVSHGTAFIGILQGESGKSFRRKVEITINLPAAVRRAIWVLRSHYSCIGGKVTWSENERDDALSSSGDCSIQ